MLGEWEGMYLDEVEEAPANVIILMTKRLDGRDLGQHCN